MAYRLTHRGAVQCNPAIRENILYSRLCARYDKSLWTEHIDGQTDIQGAAVSQSIFNAFAESKRLYVEKLKAGQIEPLDSADKVHQKILSLGGDPLPYGIEPNRKTIETLIQHAVTQGIIKEPIKVDDLFAKGTWGLVG